MSVLSAPHFHDEAAAFEMVESIVWPNGPVCPHCGNHERIYDLKGVYQHCSEKHLHRYLAEFDFRYNNRVALGVADTERAIRAVRGVAGERLTYEGPDR